MANMDMFQSLDSMQEERMLDEVGERKIFDTLIDLSPRERQSFLLHNVYLMTFAEISKELGVGRSTVSKIC